MSTKGRKTYRHGNVRGAVIEAGLAMVEEGAELTMRGLARRIDVNHNTISHEFEDLRGVKAALSMEVLGELADAVSRTDVAELSTRDALVAMAIEYCRFGVTHIRRYAFLFGPRLNLDGRHPELEDGFQRVFLLFVAVFERGTELGELRRHNALAATLQLGSSVHGFVHLNCVGRLTIPEGEFETWARSFVELPIDGLMQRLAATS